MYRNIFLNWDGYWATIIDVIDIGNNYLTT
jgi:hypothetical protein